MLQTFPLLPLHLLNVLRLNSNINTLFLLRNQEPSMPGLHRLRKVKRMRHGKHKRQVEA
jgi:hypothetical protein